MTTTEDIKHFDVIVLGAGSAGELVATTLAKKGKSVALIEELRVGGECAYLSCMPSKAMLRSAKVHTLAKKALELGASSIELELGDEAHAFTRAAERRDKIAEYRNDHQAARHAEEVGVTLIRGTGVITGKEEITVDGDVFTWGDLVIATGSSATIPEISGLADIDYWTSDEALSASNAPESILIVGGGPVGCELAQIFSTFGSKITIVEFGDQLAGSEHPEISKRLSIFLSEQGIDVLLGVEVTSVEKISIDRTLVHLSNKSSVEVNQLIIAAGRHPTTSDIGLEALDISPNKKGAIEIDDHCRVLGQDHIWAAGDVTGVAPYTHTANYQGQIISRNISGGDERANYMAIPRVIYTEPAVASVGIFESDDEKARIVTASFELSELSRNATDGESGGLLILTADSKRGVLIGAAAIGPHADEWIAEATLAIRAEVSLGILCDVVHAFPTYSEAFDAPLEELLYLCGTR
jgi:dihydrolipoamide dehydrogenase